MPKVNNCVGIEIQESGTLCWFTAIALPENKTEFTSPLLQQHDNVFPGFFNRMFHFYKPRAFTMDRHSRLENVRQMRRDRHHAQFREILKNLPEPVFRFKNHNPTTIGKKFMRTSNGLQARRGSRHGCSIFRACRTMMALPGKYRIKNFF